MAPGDALAPAFGERAGDQRRGNAEDGDVDVAGHVDNARVALVVEDDVRLRMDRIQGALRSRRR